MLSAVAGEPGAFMLTTADRRAWQVTVSDDAVRWLTDSAQPGEAELARLAILNGHHLELAALRQIARGRAQGDRIALGMPELDRARL